MASRDVVQSMDFREFFPAVEIRDDSNNKTAYDTTALGSRMICSVGGGITGHHGHVVIIDDPIDPEGAKSDAERTRAIDWIDKTLPSRILNDSTALKILIMQRLGEGDPTGHLLQKGQRILHICLPAEITTLDNVKPAFAKKFYTDGYMDIKRKGPQVLKNRKLDLGSAGYDTQYLQNPASAEGNLFRREWWRYYTELPAAGLIRIVQSWDTAFKSGEKNDFSCCTTWHQYRSGYYLVDFWMNRVESPQVIEQIGIQAAKHQPHKILIEDKASGIVALQVINQRASLPVEAIKPMTDKTARAQSAVPTIEAGNVFLPRSAPWTGDLIDRLAMFPNAQHDDDVDSITQFLNWVREQSSSFNLDVVSIDTSDGFLDFNPEYLTQF
jgi:predicted phage terminase large subunit-like protein